MLIEVAMRKLFSFCVKSGGGNVNIYDAALDRKSAARPKRYLSFEDIMEIWFTQHCGQPAYDQQDCILIDGHLHQSRNVEPTLISSECDEQLVGVADGVSGSPSAAAASRLILELMKETYEKQRDLLENGLVSARLVRRACDLFREKLARRRTYGAATTLAALHIRGDQASMLNCGDSRVYRVRPTESRRPEWLQLSRDHTIFAEMQSKGKFKGVDPATVASIYKGLAYCIVADDVAPNFYPVLSSL